jgi:non-heme chloroperoxidase
MSELQSGAGAKQEIKTVELPGRIRLEYAEQGDPSGVPVVLLHGITDSWRSFERVLPHLPPSIHAFALSLRGHGDSDRPASGYRPRDFAADLGAFVDDLGLGPVVVAGHSMGSAVAQRYAIDHPERVLGLVLVGSVTTWRGHPDFVELWDSAVSTLEDPVDPGFVREFQESTLAQPVPPEFVDTVVRESLKLPARVWKAALLEGLLRDDFSAELGRIEAPTLIVWGDRDALTENEQESLAAAIAGSRHLVYPGAGHGLHWEEPARFAADLAAFAEEVAGRGHRTRRPGG